MPLIIGSGPASESGADYLAYEFVQALRRYLECPALLFVD